MRILVNGEHEEISDGATVQHLVQKFKLAPKHIAIEVNQELVPRDTFPRAVLRDGDRVEIVTFVGGGSMTTDASATDASFERNVLKIGPFSFRNRLFVGTGKYADFAIMRQALEASGCEVVTVAVRRDVLSPDGGTREKNILEFLDLERITVLPNTAGCFSAEDAVRAARLSRELLRGLENPGAEWVKLEVLADKKTLLPEPIGTLEATRQLIADGFTVLVYTNDDPILAKRLKDEGAASVMPAGSPIGSGQGILNPSSIRLCLEYLKEDDPDYPVIVDAGVGAASDVSLAMELGSDGVLLNTAIALAKRPVQMAHAMRHAIEAGRLSYLSGRIPKKRYASASSPWTGVIEPAAG